MVAEESHIYVISELILIEYMPNEMNPKTLVDLQMMLADLLAGDESVFSRPELQTINPESIKIALDFLLKNPMLNDSQRADLLTNSWRINYRDKPPTPAEFITERYLGRAAEHTYDRVKRVFVDFMDPTKPYRNLILYPHIGWGKSYLATLVNIYTGVHLSMMRNPYKYFGLNPATILCQLLVSYSLRKSSELLLEPLLAILESSPFFEKVHTREGMIKRDQEYERSSSIDKIYWTTAVPTSAIQFSNGANFKLVSSVHNLLGLSVVTGTMSELAFFREAGKALEVSTPILLPDGSTKPIGELQVGDEIVHPTLGKTEVISIPWESASDNIYCITLDDGRTVECNAEHKWKVSYRVDPITKEKIWEVVTTRFMIDHPELDFELPEIFISKETITQ